MTEKYILKLTGQFGWFEVDRTSIEDAAQYMREVRAGIAPGQTLEYEITKVDRTVVAKGEVPCE